MIAAQFTDPENARIIFFAAGGLLVIAIGLVVATILWWRSSGIEPTALAPLEVMSTRSWWDSDEETRREQVQAARKLADLRAGPPEAGQIVERAGTLSGVSLVKSGGAESAGSAGSAEFVDDDVLDDHDDEFDDGHNDDAVDEPDEPDEPARRGYRRAAKREPELAALDRLAQLDAAPATVSAPASTPSSALAGDAGLFDQFAVDPFAAERPAESQPPPRGRRAAQRASQAAKTPQDAEADLWGGPAEPRRPIDPLLNDGDFW